MFLFSSYKQRVCTCERRNRFPGQGIPSTGAPGRVRASPHEGVLGAQCSSKIPREGVHLASYRPVALRRRERRGTGPPPGAPGTALASFAPGSLPNLGTTTQPSVPAPRRSASETRALPPRPWEPRFPPASRRTLCTAALPPPSPDGSCSVCLSLPQGCIWNGKLVSSCTFLTS